MMRRNARRLLSDVGENWSQGVINLENWSDAERHVLRVQEDVCVDRSQVVVLGDGETPGSIGPQIVCDLAIYRPTLPKMSIMRVTSALVKWDFTRYSLMKSID
jgi:hypothetical protein